MTNSVDKMVRPPAQQSGSCKTKAQGRVAKFESGLLVLRQENIKWLKKQTN